VVNELAQQDTPQYFTHRLMKKDCIEFRLYQNNIYESAKSKNTLVILPTALGKTIIAMLVSTEFLYNYRSRRIWTLVEQHKDDVNRGHIYILSTKPFPTKASDKGKPDIANKIANNEIPGIEVKNVGSLSFGWNSIHQGGYRYEFVNGIENPVLCDEFPEHIDYICKKHGLEYLDENGIGKGNIPIAELFKVDTAIYEGNNRHLQQLRVNSSFIARNKGILPLEKIKQLAMEWNQAHCKGPLDDKEFNRLFDQSLRFISEKNEDAETKSKKFDPKQSTNDNTKTCYIHKYSRGIPLAEAVIIAGKPYFIQMKGDLDFVLLDELTKDNIVLKPKDTHSYLCEPYDFESRKEIKAYLKLASEKSNFDQIFRLVKTIIQKYVVAEDHYLTLLAADIIYTYFQDKFGTTHYVICIGDNSSGKNSILMTFASLGYRVLLATSVSAANVYTFLGNLDECQGTIAEDEINNLDNDPDKLNISQVS
jgi:hypothetical protein